jgi:hypothetical protein
VKDVEEVPFVLIGNKVGSCLERVVLCVCVYEGINCSNKKRLWHPVVFLAASEFFKSHR